MREAVGKAQWVSAMADSRSTDHSITEQENVYVRYVNENGLLKTELADIVPVKSADATGIFDMSYVVVFCSDLTLRRVVVHADNNLQVLGFRRGTCFRHSSV